MKNIDDFNQKTLDLFTQQITDEVFLFIQNNRELMHDYLNLVSKNDLNVVNSGIAKAIKKRYSLENKDTKGNPKSLLIQSYEEFK